jgi:ATP-dependent Clp protease ATP-binding subunit ClpA
MWANFRQAGSDRLIFARVLETRSLLRRVTKAVPGAQITVVRLRAPLAVLHERIRSREASDPDWFLVLELSLRESLQLGHNYIGTEHILLGLIREGDGVAAQVLVRLGADLDRVRQQVIQLIASRPLREAAPGPEVQARLDVVEIRLAVLEHRVRTGPDTSDLDEQIAQVRREKESAVDARDFEQAVSMREREKELLASKAARREQWAAGHPALPVLAERVQQLADEIERLSALLREHGIDPQDKTG